MNEESESIGVLGTDESSKEAVGVNTVLFVEASEKTECVERRCRAILAALIGCRAAVWSKGQYGEHGVAAAAGGKHPCL